MNNDGSNSPNAGSKDQFTDYSRRKEFKVKSITSQDERPGQGPRSFTRELKDLCWSRAQVMLGRSPERWRLDALGNPVFYTFRGCQGPLCHEYDHIVPYSKGGRTSLENCQVLQKQVNLYKSNKVEVTYEELKNVSPTARLTDLEMDIIENAAFGNILRPKIDEFVGLRGGSGPQVNGSDNAPRRRNKSKSPNRENQENPQGKSPSV